MSSLVKSFADRRKFWVCIVMYVLFGLWHLHADVFFSVQMIGSKIVCIAVALSALSVKVCIVKLTLLIA